MAGNHNRPRRGGGNHPSGRNNPHNRSHHRHGSPPARAAEDQGPKMSPQQQRQQQQQQAPPTGPRAMQIPTPHPSFIQVAKPYVFEHTIQECLAATRVDPQREDDIRISGVTWIDNVRKALHLPVRTYNTACVYYHKFRLVHPDSQYSYMDAAAAALFTACKIEDTLKKSRDIVCAAYNLKLPPSEQVSPDDAIFDQHSRGIIILERLMLEASGFDFRNRHPQKLLVKLLKHYGLKKDDEVGIVAYCISLDLYRTFAPLKQTTGTMAFACLELASRLLDAGLEDVEAGRGYHDWKVGRAEVMETLLDLLDLYIHHRSSTVVGPEYPLDAFLAIRIPLNKESEDEGLPRFTHWRDHISTNKTTNGTGPKHGKHNKNKGKGKDQRDRDLEIVAVAAGPPPNPLTPVSANGEKPVLSDRGRDGTVRFMLDMERAKAEKKVVSSYFRDTIEEVEE
ncbi:cyclin, putative [Talaromyces stipitatus ATCC 10500]|uniref:RNA polymerase II holoenzyme cyclin-like subunit n=1 Tax=Talaromyces stipitatus (strain ATCC 10500 / CBS 375.48 / QM 6759 / NRRL 1006) TaxID=441959 RepID=B8MLC1_TALSN|nr:cyclin, putative [Talaromyces stipitatus ATCC 10500]EED15036.1 cyclin, putative [Talaromyces stipitatus ATCC 10500]